MNIISWLEAQRREKDYWIMIKKKGKKTPFKSLYRFKQLLLLFKAANISFCNPDLKVIIDIGSGPNGGILPFIAKNSFKVAVDPLLRGKLLNVPNDVNPIVAIAEMLPLHNGCCDMIFSINMLDHCSNPLNVLQEAFRVLKVNGYFGLMVHVVFLKEKIIHHLFHSRYFIKQILLLTHHSVVYLFFRLLFKILSICLGKVRSVVEDGFIHPYYFTYKELLHLLMNSFPSSISKYNYLYSIGKDPSPLKLGFYLIIF
jgi:SAM-dependent methyltransferase